MCNVHNYINFISLADRTVIQYCRLCLSVMLFTVALRAGVEG